jgi:activator of 2-hydroxyglutaryl-CoA dehydratase
MLVIVPFRQYPARAAANQAIHCVNGHDCSVPPETTSAAVNDMARRMGTTICHNVIENTIHLPNFRRHNDATGKGKLRLVEHLHGGFVESFRCAKVSFLLTFLFGTIGCALRF